MRAADQQVQGDTSRRQSTPAVCEQLHLSERAVEVSTASRLPPAEGISQRACAGRDLRAELKRVQTIVVPWNAHRRHAELSQRARDTTTSYLSVSRQITYEEDEVVATAIEECDVLVVPKQMNITDDSDGGRLRGAFVHGTKLSRRSARREREGTMR